jgi:hypothetical protein
MLTKLAGKCASPSVTVPVVAIYTRYTYRHGVGSFGASEVDVVAHPFLSHKDDGLMFETGKWLNVHK